MKHRIFFLFLIAAALVQATVLRHGKVLGVKPDLLLICAAFASFHCAAPWAIAWSLCAGVLKDVFGVYSYGAHTILFPLWSFTLIMLSRKISTDTNLARAVCLFIIATFSGIISGLLVLSKGDYVPSGIFIRNVTLEPLYTALLAPWVFTVLGKICLKRDRDREPEADEAADGERLPDSEFSEDGQDPAS